MFKKIKKGYRGLWKTNILTLIIHFSVLFLTGKWIETHINEGIIFSESLFIAYILIGTLFPNYNSRQKNIKSVFSISTLGLFFLLIVAIFGDWKGL